MRKLLYYFGRYLGQCREAFRDGLRSPYDASVHPPASDPLFFTLRNPAIFIPLGVVGFLSFMVIAAKFLHWLAQ